MAVCLRVWKPSLREFKASSQDRSILLCEHLCQETLGSFREPMWTTAYILFDTHTCVHTNLVTHTYTCTFHNRAPIHNTCRSILWHYACTSDHTHIQIHTNTYTQTHFTFSWPNTHSHKQANFPDSDRCVCYRCPGAQCCQRGLSECCHSSSSCQGWLTDMPV